MRPSKETIEKIRKSNLGKHFFKHTPKSIEKIRETSKKLWQQKWYRDKMIEVAKRPNSGQFKKGQIPWNKGKILSKGEIGKPFRNRLCGRIKKEKCDWCGSKEKLEFDHIIARKKGGTNKDDNCQVLCKKCNLLKRNTIDYPDYFHNFNAKRANSAKT